MAPIPRNTYRNESSRAKMKRKYKGNRQVKITKKLIAQIARSTQETKARLYVEQSKTPSYNGISSWNITYDLGQGVTATTRVGQKVHLVGLKLRYEMGCGLNPCVNFRVMVLFSTSQVTSAANLATADLFIENTTNNIQGLTDTRKIIKLSDQTYKVSQFTTGNADGMFAEQYISINRDFNYLLDGNSKFGEEMNLYVVVIPHSQSGSFAAGNPYFQWNGKLYFKDA